MTGSTLSPSPHNNFNEGEIDWDYYRKVVIGLRRLVVGGEKRRCRGHGDETVYEVGYRYLARGLVEGVGGVRGKGWEVWREGRKRGGKEASEEDVLKALMGEPWLLTRGEQLPPDALRLRALALGLKLFGTLLGVAKEFSSSENSGDGWPLSQLPEVWVQWWHPALQSRFPLLRHAGLLGLHQAIKNSDVVDWFQTHTQLPLVIIPALRDTSTYVQVIGCQVITQLVLLQSTTPTDSYSQLVRTLATELRSRTTLQATYGETASSQLRSLHLELLWQLTESLSQLKLKASMKPGISLDRELHLVREFILEAKLLDNFWDLWVDLDRRVKEQASETIHRLLTWFPDPKLFLSVPYRFEVSDESSNEREGGVENDLLTLILRTLTVTSTSPTDLYPTPREIPNPYYYQPESTLCTLRFLPVLTGILDGIPSQLVTGDPSLCYHKLFRIHLRLLCSLLGDPSTRVEVRSEWEPQLILTEEWVRCDPLLEKIEIRLWESDVMISFRHEMVYCLFSGMLQLLSHHPTSPSDTNSNCCQWECLAQIVGHHLVESTQFDQPGASGVSTVGTPKYFHLGLDLLGYLLKPPSPHHVADPPTTTFHHIVTRLLSEAGMGPTAFTKLLQTIRLGIVDCPPLYLEATATARELALALERRTCDSSWEIRDSVVEFLGQLFSEWDDTGTALPKSVGEFALTHHFSVMLIELLRDPETYVRTTAYQALVRLVDNPHLPPTFVRDVEHQLSELNHLTFSAVDDPAAGWQRRPHLELIASVINFHRRFISEELVDHTPAALLARLPSYLPIPHLHRLLFDADTDVILRGMRVIHSWWDYVHTLQRSLRGDEMEPKRIKLGSQLEDSYAWFLDTGLLPLMIDKLSDSSRLVRSESYRTLHTIHHHIGSLPTSSSPHLSSLLALLPPLAGTSRPSSPPPPHPDDLLAALVDPLPTSPPRRPTLPHPPQPVDWFTSDESEMGEADEELDAEQYNVMDCY